MGLYFLTTRSSQNPFMMLRAHITGIGKILGYIFLPLIAVLAIAVTKTIGWRPIIGPRQRPLTARKFESTPQRLARGKYLMQNVTLCILCHSEHDFKAPGSPVIEGTLFAGARFEEEGLPGDVYSANLTPDPETGAGGWSDDQWSRAIREGIGHDGRALFPMMPYQHFRSMSDEDVAAVVSYLKTVPAVTHRQPSTKLTFPVNYLIKSVPEPLTEPVSEPDRSTPEKRGAYLVQMATCSDCHSPSDDQGREITGLDFSGGSLFVGPWGAVASANITPDASGISYYDEKHFIQVMRTGMVGARNLSSVMPTNVFRGMTDSDLSDIFAYLKTLKAVHHRVDNNLPPTYCKLCRQKHGAGDQN
jgi:mono/diheme cytochrome c family protein